MVFKDPIRTIQVELPAGWVYDPFNSTLTDFVFVRWDQPEEMVGVHIRRASVPATQPDAKWIEKIRAEIGEAAALIDMTSVHGRAVATDFKSNKGLAQRVAFVRGPKVELVIEQRSTAQSTQNLWDPLEKAVLASSSDANLELPADYGPEEFNRAVESANLAFEKNDYPAIENALQQSIQIGTLAWLHSMISPGSALDIDAAVRVAQAMMHLGLLSSGPFQMRDGEAVLRRAQHSLDAAGLEMDWAQELTKHISETLQSMWAELLGQTDSSTNARMFPILSLRERGFRSTQAAATAFDAGDFESAYCLADVAVDDLLSLIAFLRRTRPHEIPEELAAHLSEQGIKDQEGQRDAIQKAREALLFPALNMAFQICYCCALERKDFKNASEAVAIQTPLARLIFDQNPEDAGPALNLALTMMNCAGAAALQSDDGKLDEAMRCLDEGTRIIDKIGEQQCASNGWIRYYKQQTDGSLQAIERSLAAAEQNHASRLEKSLSALRSQFQKTSARFQEAISKAALPNNQQ
jgi:hypothetical protein